MFRIDGPSQGLSLSVRSSKLSQPCPPLLLRHPRGSLLSHHPRATTLNHRAIVTPPAVVKEKHSIVSHTSLFLQQAEMGGLIGGKWRLFDNTRRISVHSVSQ